MKTLIATTMAAALFALPLSAQELSAPDKPDPAVASPFAYVQGGGKAKRQAEAAASESGARVIGGEMAEPGEWPWQVALLINGAPIGAEAQFCGGTMVLDNWVLTAAHCIHMQDPNGVYRDLNPKGISVFVGSNEIAPYHDFLDGHPAIWWPDLISARLKRRDKNYATVEALALPIVQALDNETHRSGETRMEALLLLTTALYFQSKYEEAVVIVRGILLDAPEDLKPRWRLHAELYQAIAATRSKAPEAAVMRAALLDGYMDRETAKVGDYLYLWRLDLHARRGAKADKTALVRDARAVLEFIRIDEAALKRNNEKLEALLARIFAENKDFKRAEPILRARLAEMETGTTEYYWAWQNVLAMNYLQKKYTLVLRDTRPLLEELEGKDDTYARVTSFLYRFLALSARATGDDALFHDAIQRSYVEIRRIRSANHSDALKVRSRISIAAIDPETYPYAAELGVERREAGKLTIRPDGSSVLEEFFAGRGMSVDPLERYARDNEN